MLGERKGGKGRERKGWKGRERQMRKKGRIVKDCIQKEEWFEQVIRNTD